MDLYWFQQDTLDNLTGDKHIVIAQTGAGKGAIMLHWLKSTGKKHVLAVVLPSKRDSHDVENEADAWFPNWRKSLSSFEVISWQALDKWERTHNTAIKDYAIAFDEIQSVKNGVSSLRGKAFLRIASKTGCWTGYTATPGENWLQFYPYFQATGRVKNKTGFQRDFCEIQTFRGFPEIKNYLHQDVLKKWWREISYTADTSKMERELPKANHQVIEFKPPTGYKNVIKTHKKLDGEILDTNMGFCHYLRQICATKAKMAWVSDFISGLGTNAVFFYNYKEEGEMLEQTIKKALPKSAKVWRIDGSVHDIPTADTIGKNDIVIAQWTSGSASLNLQFMNYWVSVTPHYGYATSVQARGRIRRIGQTKPQYYYYLKCNGTIEDDIYKCLRQKKDFSEDTWLIKNNIKEK